MKLERIRIRDFRNIPAAQIAFRSRRAVVLGVNGQGKTNLLEAIHLLCQTRAFRTSRVKQLLRQPEPGSPDLAEPGAFVVEGEFSTRQRGMRQARTTFRDGAMIFELDGMKCSSREYFGQLPLVLLSPESLEISRGGPDARRRYLDRLMSATSPMYLDHLLRYQRALRQRSALLALAGPKAPELDLWEEEMGRAGQELTRRRGAFLAGLGRMVGDLHARHFKPREVFVLGYDVSMDESWTPGQALDAWIADREGDARRGWSRLGPHRDDIAVLLGGMPLRTFGSQGQHKLFMLCLMLAETELLKAGTGETPLVLLDDLFGLLDDDKIKSLTEAMDPEAQVIISTTSLRHVDAIGGDVQLLACESGSFRDLEA